MRRRVDRIPAAPSKATPIAVDGRRRVVIEAVMPEIDAGRFPAKRALGETVTVEADVFADGHDSLAAVLRHRHESATNWTETPMTQLINDRWRGEFPVTDLGRYLFTVDPQVVSDMLDEVGPDALRYFFLLRSADAQMEFDVELARRQSSENPVYYAQYAHARLANVPPPAPTAAPPTPRA